MCLVGVAMAIPVMRVLCPWYAFILSFFFFLYARSGGPVQDQHAALHARVSCVFFRNGVIICTFLKSDGLAVTSCPRGFERRGSGLRRVIYQPQVFLPVAQDRSCFASTACCRCSDPPLACAHTMHFTHPHFGPFPVP